MAPLTAQVLGDGAAFGAALRRDLGEAEGLSMAVAFAKESALGVLDVEGWCHEDRRLQILAGTDFFLTELSLLRRLEQRPRAECRIFHTVGRGRSFHPKLYLLDKGERRVVYIGSSNLTRGGLADNVEANVRLEGPAEAPEIQDASALFEALFHGEYATRIRDDFELRYRAMQLAQRAVQAYPAVAAQRDALLFHERLHLGAYRAEQPSSKRWLLVASPASFAASMRLGVWARQSEHEIYDYTRGDVFFFHVTGGRGLAAFGMFTGEAYRDEAPIEGAPKGRALRWRIAIEPLGELRHGLDTKQILLPLRQGSAERWFNGFVQQSHTLDPGDFAALQRAFEEALRLEKTGGRDATACGIGCVPEEASMRHVHGSLRVCLAAAAVVVGVAGCRSHAPPGDAGAPAATSAPSAQARARFKPRHPAHVDQADDKGGFVAPRQPPPPAGVVLARPHVEIEAPPAAQKMALPKREKGHCGVVTVAGAQYAFDCMDEGYGKVASAATPLVQHDEIMGAAAPQSLPAEVDHRTDNTEGPVLDQGATLACTSFSLAAAVNHALARYLGHPGDVSPMHSWARYHKPNMAMANQVNIGHGLAPTSDIPFDAALAKRWQEGTATPEPSLLAKADAKSVGDIQHITQLARFPGDIKSALAGGQDVWFTLKAAHTLTKLAGKPGAQVVPDYDYRTVPQSESMGHAIVLAGYRQNKDGTYYLIHNSWGEKWGDKGYAYIHEKTLVKNLGVAYVVDAHPHKDAPVQQAPAHHEMTRCEGNLAPDSATSQCVPRCPEGGPRHNGVCPVASHCPAGRVNLSGRCVVAAPTYKGTVRGIKMTCAPAGCSYEIPRGTAGCADPAGCHVSCAAPRFRVGHGPRGIVCTE